MSVIFTIVYFYDAELFNVITEKKKQFSTLIGNFVGEKEINLKVHKKSFQ